MKSIRLIVAAAVACGALVLSAPAVGDTSRIKAAGSPGNWRWDPDSRRIPKGDRIVWKNPTGTDHRVHSYSNNWTMHADLDANGGKASKRFRKRGVYKFRCTVGDGTAAAHSEIENGKCYGMCGKVRVTN